MVVFVLSAQFGAVHWSARFSLIYACRILGINVDVEMLGDMWYNWGDKFFVWGCAVAEINYAPQSKMLCCRFS